MANLNILTPTGDDYSIPMNDEGVDGDLLANDGIFGAEIFADVVGDYILQPVIAGFTDDDDFAAGTTEFVRSSKHLLTVSRAEITLTGTAQLHDKNSDRMKVRLGVDVKVAGMSE